MFNRLTDKQSNEYHRLSMRRPKQLWEINSTGNRYRFKKRICEQCREPIMNHWILPFINTELRSRKWCRRDASNYSRGLVIS